MNENQGYDEDVRTTLWELNTWRPTDRLRDLLDDMATPTAEEMACMWGVFLAEAREYVPDAQPTVSDFIDWLRTGAQVD